MLKEDYRLIYKNQLETLFKWKSEMVTIPRLFETLIRERGLLGFDLLEECFVHCEPIGDLDKNNDFITIQCITLNTIGKKSYRRINHKEVILLYNNYLGTSDNATINYFAEMGEETDKSTYYQLINSRNIPVVIAENDNQKKAIEKAFNKIKAGQPCVVTTKTLQGIKTIDIIDPNNISKMECLSSFDEILDKRRYNMFGASLNTKDKKAEILTEELKAYDDITTLNFLVNYETRLAFCEEMKENGFEIEVVRNPIFADEPTDEDIENGTFEEAEVEEVEKGEETNEENPDNNTDDL